MISDRYKADIIRAQFDFSGKYRFIALFTNPAFFVRKNLYEGIRSFAPTMRGRVLDFGCGAKPYQRLFLKSTEYIGCDIEVSGHDHKNEKIDEYYDGKHLPFDDEFFDSIFSSEVFEHVGNIEEILLELNRVLKQGGYMMVSVPFIWKEHEIPFDFRRYTSFGLIKLLNEAGFEVVRSKKLTSSVETIFQLWITYIRELFCKRVNNRSMRIIFQRVIISPMIVIGIIMNLLLSRSDNLYSDNLVLCRKK